MYKTWFAPPGLSVCVNKADEKIYNWIVRFYDIPEALDIRDLERWNVALLLFLSGVSSLPVCDEPSASFDLFFSFLPPSRGPKSKGSSRCLVYPPKKKIKEKEEQRFTNNWGYQRKTTFLVLCSIYIYCRVLLTWHACWNNSQSVCICFVHLERKDTGSTRRLWTNSTGGKGLRLSVFCAKSGTWHTLVTPTAADDALHCPSSLGRGYQHLCFCHPNLISLQFRLTSSHFPLLSLYRPSWSICDAALCPVWNTFDWISALSKGWRDFKSIAKAWHYSVLQKFKYYGSRKWLLLQWKAEADCNTGVSRRHFSLKNCSPAESFGKKKKKKSSVQLFHEWGKVQWSAKEYLEGSGKCIMIFRLSYWFFACYCLLLFLG